jgi:rhodanese-related sulfurtransferase
MHRDPHRFKDSVYGHIARLGNAIANASRHLQILRAAGLVDAEKKGLYVEYRLADEAVDRFYLSLRSLAESRLAEINKVASAFFPQRKAREFVAYCRGPHCVMAVEAVDLLRNKGFKAQRLEQGVLEWRARGWRIETAAESRNSSRSRRRP